MAEKHSKQATQIGLFYKKPGYLLIGSVIHGFSPKSLNCSDANMAKYRFVKFSEIPKSNVLFRPRLKCSLENYDLLFHNNKEQESTCL